jgi:DNA-directed RNA polymerase subunit RPC12/RpoP
MTEYVLTRCLYVCDVCGMKFSVSIEKGSADCPYCILATGGFSFEVEKAEQELLSRTCTGAI